MTRFKNAIAVAVAVVVMAIIIGVAIVNWREIGETGIDLNGWIALTLGVLVTLGLGVGLMALIFISPARLRRSSLKENDDPGAFPRFLVAVFTVR